MAVFKKLRQQILNRFSPSKETEPEAAYNLWAANYDSQPDNLMLALDEEVFSALLNPVNLTDTVIADVGCGTGRHWGKILENKPGKLVGFDVSSEMLRMLQQKFPEAETHRLLTNQLPLENQSCDYVISTLTIAHIQNAKEAIAEWKRVLKRGGQIIVTDYHPIALAKGGKRTFRHKDQTVSVKNYVHTLEDLKSIAKQLDLQVLRLIETSIDDSMRPYYEKQNALPVFDVWKGTPIIYGISLIRKDATL